MDARAPRIVPRRLWLFLATTLAGHSPDPIPASRQTGRDPSRTNRQMNLTPEDLDTVIRTGIGEVRGEPELGQDAMFWVVRNRVEHPAWWGHTPTEVCKAKWQFSCWIDAPWNAANLKAVTETSPDNPLYLNLKRVAEAVFSDRVPDPTAGATHYKVTGTKASWDAAAAKLTPVVIGHHSFYRLGANG